mmetsp:Transcript_29574/g.92328  ORF Transcript_29574/g.92328 Transcript_29574/m.92328 type:complete len:271 (-) Transcript_29574:46-858(-)
MLASRCKRPNAGILSKTAACRDRRAVLRERRGKPQQTLLAIARRCRECGEQLGALEGALHSCTMSLEWPHGGAESLAELWPGAGAGAGGTAACRLLRLGSGLLAAAASARFAALWDFIRGDLSHGLDPPSPERVAAGAATVFLGLRGREVVGLIWAESIGMLQRVECLPGGPSCESVASLGAGSSPDRRPGQAARAAIGVVLIWVRRSERRRGLATALVEAVRRHAAGPGGRSVPREAVAFSQPTDLGLEFARGYAGAAHGGQVRVYHLR